MEKNETPLDEYRRSIDNIDAALVFLLAERFRITEKVGFYKKENGLPAEDSGREERQERRLSELAASAGLDPELAVQFFRQISSEVKRKHQEKIYKP